LTLRTPAPSLLDDQNERWRRGERAVAEDYLGHEGALQSDREALLDLLYNEIRLREERGEALEPEEYCRRFPELAELLRDHFEIHRALQPGAGLGELSEPASAVRIPRPHGVPPEIAGYEVLRELGRGAMGIVYKARQLRLDRIVALKMILAGAHAGPMQLGRFETEARAVARLQHPHIVQIFEVGEHEGKPFLCLEYVEGNNLHELAYGTLLPERDVARLVALLARAVQYTHAHGILHRDLKPGNILLTADGTPKITDFGLAKLLDVRGSPTPTEGPVGTPSYMAPEQAAGDLRKIGTPADVYALGAILYELLAGRPPFKGESLFDTLQQVRTREPVPPRRFRGSLTRDLETICLKCLEKDPEKRYASAGALADDLERFLEGQPIQARPIAAWERLWRAARRQPTRVAAAAGVAALVCVLVTSGWYFRAAAHLARYRGEERYQQFVQRRNDAFFHGLLASDLFQGAQMDNSQAAESAAREALALAGVAASGPSAAPPGGFPAERQAEVAEDCYALLLVLAGVRGRPALPEPAGKARHQEALRTLDQAGQLGFETRGYHLRRAHLLEQLGEQEEARRARDRAAACAPHGALDHFLCGEEHYRGGDWKKARNYFDRVLALQPAHLWAQFLLAVCQLNLQNWEAAKAGLNACLAQHPDFAWAYLYRSFAHEKLQAWPEAEIDFQRTLQLNLSPEARYVLFNARGILHFHQRELERAAADFRSARDLKPGHYNAYLNLAHVYLAEGQFEQATEQVARALGLGPPAQVVADYHVACGRKLLLHARYEAALRACDAARKLAPRRPLLYRVRGQALLGLARYQEAEESFDQCLREGGDAVGDVFRGRGQARMRLGRYPEAVDDYTRALEQGPDADLYQHRGWAHFFADAWKLSLRDFEKALELDPEMGDAYTGRGLARVMLGQYREAVRDGDAALRHEPGSPEMMHNIACIFAQAAAQVEVDREEEARQARTADYRGGALRALRQTIRMLPPEERPSFWRDKIRPDAALAPIRNDAGFQRLQEECMRPR
jgi:tetratricopeptide (TPR) repeat protein